MAMTVFGFGANKTIDLRQTNTPLVQNNVIRAVASDFENNGVYMVGSDGAFGYYSFISDTTVDLRATAVADWISINNVQFFDVAYDSKNDGAYIVGTSPSPFPNSARLGYYNRASNQTVDLSTDSFCCYSQQSQLKIAYDAINDGLYIISSADGGREFWYFSNGDFSDLNGKFGGNSLDGVTFDVTNNGAYVIGTYGNNFGFYNPSTDIVTNFDTGIFSGNSLKSIAYDKNNNGVYIAGTNGMFLYYDLTANSYTNLSNAGQWINTTTVNGVVYDDINDGAYIAGDNGLIGHYMRKSNITIDLRSPDAGDWLRSQNPNILGIAFDNKTKGIYFSGSGVFGAYSFINIVPVKTGVSVNVVFDNNATLAFTNVISAGETTIDVSATPPANATGFLLNGTYYDIQTTANYSGTIVITLPYDPSIPPPLARDLKIYHYDKTLNSWVDVTTSISIPANLVIGAVTSLSPFAVGLPTRNFEFLAPISNNNTPGFNLGGAIPIKFQLVDDNGNFITNATALIFLSKVNEDGTLGLEQAGVSKNNPKKVGNTFRFSGDEDDDENKNGKNHYIFNLNTKVLTEGKWRLRVLLDDEVSYTTDVLLIDKDDDRKRDKDKDDDRKRDKD